MRRIFLWVIGLCAALSAFAQPPQPTTDATYEVAVSGHVFNAGKHRVAAGGRMFDAVIQAQVRQDAYLLGAAWYSKSEQHEQLKLKLGIIYDLQQLSLEARSANREARAHFLQRIATQVEHMPITGRRLASLDPILMELELQYNRPLTAGDLIFYPSRPTQIQITGAVLEDCTLPFVGLREITSYIQECPLHPEADSDWLWVIEPDGLSRRIGIGAWNKEPPQFLAPGARLFVPIRQTTETNTDLLNTELPKFIATQPLLGTLAAP